MYCSTKFAVRSLTQSAAQEWAEHGITVNAYCPGIVDTTMWEEIDRDLGAIKHVGKGESMKAMAAGITLGRVSTGRTSRTGFVPGRPGLRLRDRAVHAL